MVRPAFWAGFFVPFQPLPRPAKIPFHLILWKKSPMLEQVAVLEKKALDELAQAPLDLKWLQDFDVRVLGKKGELTLLLRETGKLPDAERPGFGARVNAAKQAVLVRLDAPARRSRGQSPEQPPGKRTHRRDPARQGHPLGQHPPHQPHPKRSQRRVPAPGLQY